MWLRQQVGARNRLKKSRVPNLKKSDQKKDAKAKNVVTIKITENETKKMAIINSKYRRLGEGVNLKERPDEKVCISL